jgi:diguanylate cyclase
MEGRGVTLRALILEDRETDAELVATELQRAGYALEWRRVDTEAAYLAALDTMPQIILADYSLPQFNALEALRLLRTRSDAVPFIVVSGTIGEEIAVTCLQAGADDYLLKDRLARLGHAVSRALAEQELRQRGRAAEAERVHQSLYDPLTDLPNRVLLRTHLQRALEEHVTGSPSLALLLVDLDRFKEVNETLGHQVGDMLLQQLGERLRNAIPVADLVARLGGDEFALLVAAADATRAAGVAEEVRCVLLTPFVLEGQSIAVEASIGIALGPEHGQDADSLLRRAGIAMSQAKHLDTGLAIYRSEQDRDRSNRLALLGELRSGLDENELRLHYQPKLDMRDGKLVGVEALVRWQHPQRGLLAPSEFVPLAEQTALIYPITLWVLETALQQHQAWRAMGLNVPVAVNLSRRMLHDQRLPETVAQMLARWDVLPTALVLEITETSLMTDPTHARDSLAQLRDLGVRMSIDDFGTGYSTLASLRDLSVDELKIDQSFVQGMATDASARAVVRAIIELGVALKLSVVAEGVEDRATWDVLTGLGCEVAQGFFLSPPIAAGELQTWVAQMSQSWLDIAARSGIKETLEERILARGARLTVEEEFMARKQAEAALRASEERNRVALQAASMGTWDWDVVSGVQTWSAETEALYGLAPGTFDGTVAAFQRAVYPEDWAAVQIEMRAADAERRESISTYRTVWADGSVHWLESRGRGLYAGDGTLVRMSGTSMDITERKQIEAALFVSEERNRLALRAAGMGTWDFDAVHNLSSWSTETEALCGLAPGTFDGTFAGLRRSVHPDDWPAFAAEMQAYSVEHPDLVSTYRTVWPDGTARWLENKGHALFVADGSMVRVTGTTMDITERKLSEVALRASEQRFRKQYKGFPLPTYSWLQVGDEFVLQDVNDAAESLDDAGRIGDAIGSPASQWYAHQPEILVDLHACLARQLTIRREIHYRYPVSGRERDLLFSYVFVPSQTVMIHTEDVTHARLAEQQRVALAQSEKLRALGQMATGIAHDLNQSLMLVASYSDLARQALVEDPPNMVEAQDLLTTTTQAALDGGVTVKRLLLFTRAAPEQDRHRVDLGNLVRDAAQLTAPRWRDAAQAEGRPISLHMDSESRLTVEGSPARLRELLTNLIFNAVDALPTGGMIRMRVRAEDGQGIIEISDSGIGMSVEVQARVFEPFFTTKGEGGTGLGLAMVFGIVEQHGGHIEVRSAPGDGTTFRISLPLVEAVAESEPSPPVAAQLEPSRPLRILVVDDEPMMTKALVRMLKPSGHTMSVAASGQAALDQLAEQTFDVVLSDMSMGAGMNGWELAEAVRRDWPGVRFLLATGWGAAMDVDEMKARGVEAVLSKPYLPADLLRILARTDKAA